MSKNLITTSRRGFLRAGTAALATISVVPGCVLGLRGAVPPNNKLNIAAIGKSPRHPKS